MNLVDSSYEIITQGPTINDMFKHIELAGRTCYKSEDKITSDSAKEFINKLIIRGHTSVLEHGSVYLKIPFNSPDYYVCKSVYSLNDYSRVYMGDMMYISTNYRVLLDTGRFDDLQYWCEPTNYHSKRYTVRIICDRAISHQIVRHRRMSYSQESQRYCNYSKDKFNKGITFISPYGDQSTINDKLKEALETSEKLYLDLISLGCKPEKARKVLINSTKTELVITGFYYDWQHIFNMRDSKFADPDCFKIFNPLHKEFKDNSYCD